MNDRLVHAVEGLVFAALAAALLWIIGAILNALFSIEIRTDKTYTAAIICGFISRHVLLVVIDA